MFCKFTFFLLVRISKFHSSGSFWNTFCFLALLFQVWIPEWGVQVLAFSTHAQYCFHIPWTHSYRPYLPIQWADYFRAAHSQLIIFHSPKLPKPPLCNNLSIYLYFLPINLISRSYTLHLADTCISDALMTLQMWFTLDMMSFSSNRDFPEKIRLGDNLNTSLS